MEYHKLKLQNGTRLVVLPRTETQAVTVMLGVGVGSRYENENVAGISHYVEHMNFKGSKKRPTPKAVSDFINDIGGYYNAYTDKELTAYYVKISSDHLSSALDYVCDNVVNPLNKKDEFEKERTVVIEDIKMHKDRPMEEASELFEEKVFSELSLGRRIAGTVESVSNITHEQLVEFRNKHYISDSVVITVAGNLGRMSKEDIYNQVKESLSLPRKDAVRVLPSKTTSKKMFVSDQRKTEQTNLIIGFGGPGLKDKDRYAARMLSAILGGSSSSRMFMEIREKLGLAYAVNTQCFSYSDTGAIFTLANIDNNNVEKSFDAIRGEYKKILVQKKVDDSEIDRVKEIVKSQMLINLEDSEELAEAAMKSELIQNIEYSPDEIINSYLAITKNDIVEAAEKYLDFDKMVVSAVGPKVGKLQKI